MSSRVFVSVRGYVKNPTLIEIEDLRTGHINRKIELSGLQEDYIPDAKRGLSGLKFYGNKIIVATWAQVLIIDPNSGDLVERYKDKRFSDLHGLCIENNGDIWVANTNLDSVYRISNGKIEEFWSAWNCDRLGNNLPWTDRDYSQLEKKDIPYHNYHVNSVYVDEHNVFVSYLGRPPSATRLQCLLIRFGVLKKRYREGGIFVIDRATQKLRNQIACEGLHDPKFSDDGYLYYTEYFGNALLKLDPCTLKVERIALKVPSVEEWGYLSRGLLFDGSNVWVGHTKHNGWKLKNPSAMIREYSCQGDFLGNELLLPGYVGIYDLVRST